MTKKPYNEEQIIDVIRQYEAGTKVEDICQELGKPTQNAFVESLSGKFRNECLNQHERHHYNNERPHSSLKVMTPVAFANRAA